MTASRYEPLVYVDEGGEVFPKENPYPPTKRARFVKFKRGAAETQAQYGGLRVQVALIRQPGYDPKNLPRVAGSEDVYRLMQRQLETDVQEGFYVLLLTARNHVTGIYEAHRGTLTDVSVHPADVLRPVLVAGAPAFIVVHNHPSGDAEPSPDDRKLTKELQAAAKTLQLSLLDHLVIGADGYVSFADRGLL